MRFFLVRSVGGKLIIFATLTLLLCILLLTLTSWGSLKYASEQQVKDEAQIHLTHMKQTYQASHTELVRHMQALTQLLKKTPIASLLTQVPLRAHLQEQMTTTSLQYHLSTIALISTTYQPIIQVNAVTQGDADHLVSLRPFLMQTLHGQPITSFQQNPQSTGPHTADWSLTLAIPVYDISSQLSGFLLAIQPMDRYSASMLAQQADITGSIALCLAQHLQSFSDVQIEDVVQQHRITEQALCTPGTTTTLHTNSYYLAQATTVRLPYQATNSPTLTVVAIEPLYVVNLRSMGFLRTITGLAVFIFALGVLVYTTTTHLFVIRPLRQLQAYARALTTHHQTQPPKQDHMDELSMLVRSFNTLAESLDNESRLLTEQMGNLLIMSDALISTLQLNHLLGEIVTRLGNIMHARHVSLLLYGRAMSSPWAAAQWTQENNSPTHTQSSPQHMSKADLPYPGNVTVHIDPSRDITLVETTKIAALPKSKAQHSPNFPQHASLQQNFIAKTPVERIARELDMTLARMVIQRKKIAYGEDIEKIVRERQDSWAQLALNFGYRAAIAVPLLLQDQAIGAVLLYMDQPHQISSRDTFLLSTAAIQASMAIQNALFFAELKEKNTALERANQLKSQFLANVTHELRSPLHSIISYGALILEGFVEGELTPEQEEHIQFIIRRAEDLSHLVDDMLDLSKIEADRIEIKLEHLDLSSCLADVLNQLKPLANNKHLYLTLEIDKDLPLALADSHRVRQITINLVSNALKFTEKGGVTIHCTLHKALNMLLISVRDTGIGISPAALEYIFEAFRQADGSTTRRFGGTGLGLTIARKLVELQEGEIIVESTLGQGSTFSFTLPIVTSSLSHA